jgi:hypothetical protein
MNSKLSSLFPTLLACKWGCEFASWIQSPITPSPDQPELRAVPIDNEQAKSKGGNAGRARSFAELTPERGRARFFAQSILNGQSEILRCAQDDSEGLCRNSTSSPLDSARVAQTYFLGPRLVPDGQGKAADLKNRSALPFLGPSFFPSWAAARLSVLRITANGLGMTARALFSAACSAPPFQTRDEKSELGGGEHLSFLHRGERR